MRIILASKSPRRKELLKSIFNDFDIIPSTVDENKYPLDKLSLVKAEEIANKYPSSLNSHFLFKIYLFHSSVRT